MKIFFKYLFYVTKDMISVSGNVSGLQGKRYKVKWFDPLTGEFHDAGEKEFGNSSWISLRRDEKITGPIAVAILEQI